MIKRVPLRDSAQVQVTFALPPHAVAANVSVVGDFNDWDPGAHPFRLRSNGTRSVTLTLPAGERFAFRYLDETGQWFDDDSADAFEPNGIGGKNGVIAT